MFHLVQLGLVLVAQAAWETTPIHSEERPWLWFAACVVPFALGALAKRWYLAGRFRLADRAFFAALGSPAVLFAILVLIGGWNEWLERTLGAPCGLFDWPTPRSLVVVAPFVVYVACAVELRARLAGRERAPEVRRAHARMFLWTLVPLVGYVAVASAIGASERARLEVDNVALWSALYGALLVGLFALVVPRLFVGVWNAKPLAPGPERELFDAVSARAGFDGRRLYVWDTGRSASNAAIVGLLPWHRIVVFSDLLLAQLDLRQLASVYAHEIGHARRGHVLIFSAWALAALFGGELVAAHSFPDDPTWGSAILLLAMAVWVLGFGWMSRRFELEADVFSLRLLGDAGPLVEALERVSGPHGRARTSWRHFSTERRIEFLARAVRDPSVAERLERLLRRVSWTGFAAFVLVMAAQGWSLWERWPTDRLVVDLRRGDYPSAAARLDAGLEVEPSLARLVARARTLPWPIAAGDTEPAPEPTAVRLAERAREALLAGRAEEAAEWLELGALRGDRDMALVRELLALEEPLGPTDRAGALAALAEPWREVVETRLPAFRAGPPTLDK